jgi:hypothetical protein
LTVPAVAGPKQANALTQGLLFIDRSVIQLKRVGFRSSRCDSDIVGELEVIAVTFRMSCTAT